MQERIEVLDKIFTLSMLILKKNLDRKYFLGILKAHEMLTLVQMAYEEIHQPKPNLPKIDQIIFQLAIITSQPLPKFESGAVPSPNPQPPTKQK